VLDKSNETEKYSAATFLVHAGIQTLIDDQHAIAHNKVMVIDSATILTGSFNFTLAGCRGYASMNPASVVPFATEAEAQQAGYRRAKDCP
jgi:PLD-like domain